MKKLIFSLVLMFSSSFALSSQNTTFVNENVETIEISSQTVKTLPVGPKFICTVSISSGGVSGTGIGIGDTLEEACQNATKNALDGLKVKLD